MGGSWLVAGNFNDIAFAHEKKEELPSLTLDVINSKVGLRSVVCWIWKLLDQNLLGGDQSIMEANTF